MSKLKKIALLLIPLLIIELSLRAAGIGQAVVYQNDLDVGYLTKPLQKFRTMGHQIEILDTGFRGPPATNNILFVGDSVTYGTAFIPDHKTFPALLGGHNAGVNGWGPQNIEAFLQKLPIEEYSLVVWTLPSCDLFRPFMTLRNGLISTTRPMVLRLEYLLRFVWYGFLMPAHDGLDEKYFQPNYESLVRSVKHLSDNNVEIMIVLLPSREESMGQTVPETDSFGKLHEIIQLREINHILAIPPTDHANELFRDSVHLTEAGNQWLAQNISDHLRNTLRNKKSNPLKID